MCFSIRLLAEEKRIAESYAKMRSMSLEEAFKQALFERIEDEYDVAVAAAAYAEYEMSGRKSRPISELWKEGPDYFLDYYRRSEKNLRWK